MEGRWGGLRALLERIEREDRLEDLGGEREAVALAHNCAAERWEETRKIVKRLWGVVTEIAAEKLNSEVGKTGSPDFAPSRLPCSTPAAGSEAAR